MTISEIIKELTSLMAVHGDIRVVSVDLDGDETDAEVCVKTNHPASCLETWPVGSPETVKIMHRFKRGEIKIFDRSLCLGADGKPVEYFCYQEIGAEKVVRIW